MKNISRLHFAHLPTTIEALPRLSARLGGQHLFVKRDDQTGLGLGGNKTRKLEYLLADAQAIGARTLITAGAVQSNHCRQTAAAAARYGFDCILVLSGQPERVYTGNVLLDNLLGAEIIWSADQPRDQVLGDTFQAAHKAGRMPYLIPYGGSNPTGAAGYVQAIAELIGQISSNEFPLGVPPDWIIVASSSGGTQAGLVLGAKCYGYSGNILGISVDETEAVLKRRVADLASQTAIFLGIDLNFHPEEILVNADYLGGGYGIVGHPEREAIRLFAQTEGLLLDPVYTGRAAAGMIDLIHKGYFYDPQTNQPTILFWHTGGIPALFADKYRGVV